MRISTRGQTAPLIAIGMLAEAQAIEPAGTQVGQTGLGGTAMATACKALAAANGPDARMH